MVELWFGLLCFTLTVFAVLDGGEEILRYYANSIAHHWAAGS